MSVFILTHCRARLTIRVNNSAGLDRSLRAGEGSWQASRRAGFSLPCWSRYWCCRDLLVDELSHDSFLERVMSLGRSVAEGPNLAQSRS